MADVNSRTVMRALADLGGYENPPRNVTAAQIAEYLKCPADTVLGHLHDLKRSRIVTDRRRSGERVWVSWGVA